MLISTEELAAATGARIADASWFLPEHQRDAAAEFAAGHIPGAVFLDLDSLADANDPLPMMLAPEAAFARRVGELGIADTDRIILYDDSPLRSAARAWWALTTMGARDVAILDGGLAKWRAEGRPLTSEPAAIVPAIFHATRDESLVADCETIRATAAQIVDARGPARFAGAEPEPRPGVVPGHIPGAINLPYPKLFNPDGTWKQGEALTAAFADADVDIDRPIIATCGSGVTAAVLVFGLALLGHPAPLYDGSWADWGSRPDTPKATGA